MYRACARSLNRLVALKMLLNGAHLSPEARERSGVRLWRWPGSSIPISSRYSKSATKGVVRTSSWNWLGVETSPAGWPACPGRHEGARIVANLPEPSSMLINRESSTMSHGVDAAELPQWRSVPMTAQGFVNFGPLCSNADHVSAYAVLRVFSPEKQRVAILVGSDDTIRLRLNGKLIHEHLQVQPGDAGRGRGVGHAGTRLEHAAARTLAT